MKKYNTPELKILAFAAEESIAAVRSSSAGNTADGNGSNLFNDAEFGAW